MLELRTGLNDRQDDQTSRDQANQENDDERPKPERGHA